MRMSAAKIWAGLPGPPLQRPRRSGTAIVFHGERLHRKTPRGFIEGRGLGSALILEFLLHYLTNWNISWLSARSCIWILCWTFSD